MKSTSALTVLCLATLLLATTSPLAFAKKSPFVDFWTATDPVDGSTLTAHIYGSPQGSLHFSEYDNYASGCVSVLPSDPNEVPVGTLTGTGTLISPDVLAVSGQVTCVDLTTGATVVIPGTYITFTYNPSSDTLLSSWNELFYRV